MDDLLLPAAVPVTLPVAGGGRVGVHRIYCIGQNYAEHAREMGGSGREPPFFFMKPADALVAVAEGEVGTIDYPGLTSNLHHEVELVVVLGADLRPWAVAVGLDMTRRDLQAQAKERGRPWEIAKGFEQSAPIGPLQRLGAAGVPRQGAITLAVNGQPRQRGDLADLVWNVDEALVHLAAAWTLRPGDLVFTGTPAGVGPVQRGDRLRASIDGVGTLEVAVR